MSNIKVYFLGEEYNVPIELKEFVGYLHYFENIYNEFMSLLINKMKNLEFADFNYYKKELVKLGEKIICKLSENGILDVTINDIIYNNKGYIQLNSVCSETFQGMIDILNNAMQNWQVGCEEAYESAASNITGSGISIWTNSFSSALIYSMFEESTLKEQANRVNKQYISELDSLSKNVDDIQEKQKAELLVNKYYPGVSEAVAVLVSEMMEYYVTKLEQHGIFVYSKVKEYDLKRSSDLLKNISIVSDRKGLLKKAFVYCPYNPDIYKAVMENNLSDVPTFETAKYFMLDCALEPIIHTYCKNNIENHDLIVVPIKILSFYNQQSEKDTEDNIWREVYIDKIVFLLKYHVENQKHIKIQKDELEALKRQLNKLSNKIKNCKIGLFISIILLILFLCFKVNATLNLLTAFPTLAIIIYLVSCVEEKDRTIIKLEKLKQNDSESQ